MQSAPRILFAWREQPLVTGVKQRGAILFTLRRQTLATRVSNLIQQKKGFATGVNEISGYRHAFPPEFPTWPYIF